MSFIDFARAGGLLIEHGQFHASDRIHRCGTMEHPRSKNGSYFWDGRRGWVWAWDGEAMLQWYSDGDPWTDAEKADWKARRAVDRREREVRHVNAARAAQDALRAAKTAPHDYLVRKGFAQATGLVNEFGALLIPMQSLASRAVVGLQSITWDEIERKWEKRMWPGMKAKGAVFRIGSRGESYFCEGYATGLSVRAALDTLRLRAAVVVCFSASNLEHVAPLVKGQRYVIADNDESETGERAAKATGLPYFLPPDVGDDFNDFHQRRGIFEAAKCLQELRMG
jgi:putative DNA primase/helicase